MPYKWGGYDFDGTFCFGLVYLFYKHALGIELPKYTTTVDAYKNLGDASETFERESQEWIRQENSQPSDVVLIRRGDHIIHCGILVAKKEMLHIQQQDRLSCVARLDSYAWSHRIYGYYRHRIL